VFIGFWLHSAIILRKHQNLKVLHLLIELGIEILYRKTEIEKQDFSKEQTEFIVRNFSKS
jgi:hypothetical protein